MSIEGLVRGFHVARPRGTSLAVVLVVPVLCVLLLPAAVWLDAQAPAHDPVGEVIGGPGWPWVVNGAVLGMLAAVVLVTDWRQGFGWLLAGFGLFWSLDGLSQSYVHAGLSDEPAWPAMTFALWFLNRFGVYLTAVVAVLLLVFPTGRFLPGRWRAASWAAVVALVLSGLAVIVAPAEGDRLIAGVPPSVDQNPTSIPALAGHGTQVVSLGVAIGGAAFMFSLVTVVVRYLTSTGIERDRMRWLVWSVVVIVALVAAGSVFPVPDYVEAFAATVVPPAAMTVAIVRPTLVSIQDLFARTLVVAAVVVVLAAADVVVLAALTLVLDDDLSHAQVVAAVLLVSVLFYGPLRQRLSRGVQRLVTGQRGDRYDTVSSLALALERADDPDDQLAAAARAVARAFGVRFVGLEIDRGRGIEAVTSYGARPAEVRTLPIAYRGVGVGRLVLPARGLRSRLGTRDEALLADLVRQAAAAARTSQLAEELQASREGLVTAREEERRRIRRDLHDGLGPALSGMVFQLEAARLTLDDDPDRARDQIATVAGQAQAVVADVRRLVHGLRPPALDDRGLVGALGLQAETLGLDLELGADDDLTRRLPAAVEVAAYRIAAEALTNVARHAGTTHVRIELGLDAREFSITVSDDGVGIAAERQSGVGLVSLRERAAELGGVVEITCPQRGGTTVRATLPIRSTP